MVPKTFNFDERSAIEAAIEARQSFIVLCDSQRDEAVAFVEEAIEKRGFRCRVYQAGRSAAAAAGLLTPTGIGQLLGAATMVGVAAHRFVTMDPDWEIAKQISSLKVTWTRKPAEAEALDGGSDGFSPEWHGLLEGLLSKHVGAIARVKSDLFQKGKVPEKKLKNACAAYAPVSPDRVLYLYDCTLFGAGDDGFVITDEGFYFKELLISPPVSFTFGNVAEVTSEKDALLITQTDGRKIRLPKGNTAFNHEPLRLFLHEMLESPHHAEELARLEHLRAAAAEGPQAEAAPQRDSDVDRRIAFAEYLDRLILRIVRDHDKLYRKGSIPDKKLKGSTDSYAPVDSKDIIFLYDTTISGSAAEGFCVTPQGFYYSYSGTRFGFYFTDVVGVDLTKNGLTVTLSNGNARPISRDNPALHLLEFRKFLAGMIGNSGVVVPIDHAAETKRLIERGEIQALLSVCRNEELDPIVSALTSSMTCTLGENEEYKSNRPNHVLYYGAIADEICSYAGNTFANMTRGGQGPTYRETLKVVCSATGVEFHDDLVETEKRILIECLGADWEVLAPENVKVACKDAVTGAGVGHAALSSAMYAAKAFALGGGNPIMGAASALAGPGYRVLIPCVVHVARLRMSYMAGNLVRPEIVA